MTATSDSALEAIDCEVLEERFGARVVIRRTVRKAYDSLDDQKKGRLNAIMRLWCEGRPLTPKMFNGNEGRTSRRNLMLQAFKTFKVRFYGFSIAVVVGALLWSSIATRRRSKTKRIQRF